MLCKEVVKQDNMKFFYRTALVSTILFALFALQEHIKFLLSVLPTFDYSEKTIVQIITRVFIAWYKASIESANGNT